MYSYASVGLNCPCGVVLLAGISYVLLLSTQILNFLTTFLFQPYVQMCWCLTERDLQLRKSTTCDTHPCHPCRQAVPLADRSVGVRIRELSFNWLWTGSQRVKVGISWKRYRWRERVAYAWGPKDTHFIIPTPIIVRQVLD